MATKTYAASIGRGIGRGGPLLLLVAGALLLFGPDMALVVRVLGALSLLMVGAYLVLIASLRVEVGDEQVRVRRALRWRTYVAGDDFYLESIKPLLGRRVENLVLHSDISGLSRTPIGMFREAEMVSLQRRLEAVVGAPGIASPRPRRRGR